MGFGGGCQITTLPRGTTVEITVSLTLTFKLSFSHCLAIPVSLLAKCVIFGLTLSFQEFFQFYQEKKSKETSEEENSVNLMNTSVNAVSFGRQASEQKISIVAIFKKVWEAKTTDDWASKLERITAHLWPSDLAVGALRLFDLHHHHRGVSSHHCRHQVHPCRRRSLGWVPSLFFFAVSCTKFQRGGGAFGDHKSEIIRSFRLGVVLWMRLRHSRSELHIVPWMNQEILSRTCLLSFREVLCPSQLFPALQPEWLGRAEPDGSLHAGESHYKNWSGDSFPVATGVTAAKNQNRSKNSFFHRKQYEQKHLWFITNLHIADFSVMVVQFFQKKKKNHEGQRRVYIFGVTLRHITCCCVSAHFDWPIHPDALRVFHRHCGTCTCSMHHIMWKPKPLFAPWESIYIEMNMLPYWNLGAGPQRGTKCWRLLFFSVSQPQKDSLQLPLLVVARLAFIPLFMLCNIHPRSNLPVYFAHDGWFIAFMALFAFSNGYLASLCMCYGPKWDHERGGHLVREIGCWMGVKGLTAHFFYFRSAGTFCPTRQKQPELSWLSSCLWVWPWERVCPSSSGFWFKQEASPSSLLSLGSIGVWALVLWAGWTARDISDQL